MAEANAHKYEYVNPQQAKPGGNKPGHSIGNTQGKFNMIKCIECKYSPSCLIVSMSIAQPISPSSRVSRFIHYE